MFGVAPAKNPVTLLTNVAVFDPTPTAIRNGRKHLYDTRSSSGLGQVSCASCHVDGRFDRLAWDLGNPSGEMIYRGTSPFTTNVFHPLKGPMVTQTFQDMLGIKHWRGDRAADWRTSTGHSPTCSGATRLTTKRMSEFKDSWPRLSSAQPFSKSRQHPSGKLRCPATRAWIGKVNWAMGRCPTDAVRGGNVLTAILFRERTCRRVTTAPPETASRWMFSSWRETTACRSRASNCAASPTKAA
jgi:hypothetical protein